MENVIAAQGSIFAVGGAALVGCTNLSGPSFTVTQVPTNVLADERKNSRPGMPEPGEISGSGYMDTTNYAVIFGQVTADASDQASRACLLTYSDGSTFGANGYWTALAGNGLEEDGNAGYDFTFQLNGIGAITFTPAEDD